jgi:hypothetical protein
MFRQVKIPLVQSTFQDRSFGLLVTSWSDSVQRLHDFPKYTNYGCNPFSFVELSRKEKEDKQSTAFALKHEIILPGAGTECSPRAISTDHSSFSSRSSGLGNTVSKSDSKIMIGRPGTYVVYE